MTSITVTAQNANGFLLKKQLNLFFIVPHAAKTLVHFANERMIDKLSEKVEILRKELGE